MEKIYTYLHAHKGVLWTILTVSVVAFAVMGVRCYLEEDIAKLLPISSEDKTIEVAFSQMQVKDKIFVEVRTRDDAREDEPDRDMLTEVMDAYMESVTTADSATGMIKNTLYEVNPIEMMDAAMYMAEHAPLYLDFDNHQMDSLTSMQHIQEVVAEYMALLETDNGIYLYDILGYDPCGIVMAKITGAMAKNNMNDDDSNGFLSKFQNNHMLADGGYACIGFITPAIATTNSGITTKLVKNLNHAKAEIEQEYPSVEILLHGSALQSVGNSACLKRDLVRTIGLSLLVICVLLVICLKDPRYLLMLILPIVYGGLLALASMWAIKGSMSLIALGLGAVVLGVALSYSLHVLVHYIYTHDVMATIHEQTKPVLMGSITTIGAFMGLLFTKSSLLSDFGAFAVITLIGTTFASLVFMPHFFPSRPHHNRKAFRILHRINNWHVDRNKPICIGVSLLVVVCMCFSGKYTFDSDLYNIGYVSTELQHATDQWQADNNGGMMQKYYAAMAPSLEEALEALPLIEQKCDSLKAIGKISSYTKVSALLPAYSQQRDRAAHWNAYFSEAKQAETWRNIEKACARQDVEADMFWAFKEAMATEYEAECLYEVDLVPEEIACNFIEHVGDQYLIFLPILHDPNANREIMDCLTKVENCIVLDPFYYSTSLVELIHDDFNLIMLVSSIFVFFILLVSYRRIGLTLVAFFPMMLSWYTVLGAMALAGLPFNLINIVVSTLVFGVGVDYSIFIMDGLMAETKGEDPKRLAYHKTAITMSGTILVICMFSLLFAEHPALNSISFASLVGMITTMLLSYTLQPNVYRWYLKLREKFVRL